LNFWFFCFKTKEQIIKNDYKKLNTKQFIIKTSVLSLEKFQKNFQTLQPNPDERKFLLAVSGGADSMVLLYLFQSSGFKFQVAHINYKLRGKDSDDDQKIVENFCKKYSVKIHIYEVSEDEKPENSIQIWARNLRYDFFRKIMKSEDLDFLVTAHHLNDHLETFLINLSRGSGIKGLCGIPENENGIIRPLLPFSKNEIYDFANENGIEFREDKSNQKNDYLRNKIRNEIVPKLLETNDHFLENFSKSIGYLNQAKDFTEEKTEEIFNAISTEKEGNTIIDKAKFSSQPDFVKFEVLRKFGFSDEKEISKIFTAETGKSFYSLDFQILINRNELIVSNRKSEIGNQQDEIVLEIIDNEIIIPENIKREIQKFGNCNWKFDSDKIVFPLKLRYKKQGDEFFPTGMQGRKKVSKFFKDEKISVLEKSKIRILCDGNDEILGILLFRQDRRFAADPETRTFLKITC